MCTCIHEQAQELKAGISINSCIMWINNIMYTYQLRYILFQRLYQLYHRLLELELYTTNTDEDNSSTEDVETISTER